MVKIYEFFMARLCGKVTFTYLRIFLRDMTHSTLAQANLFLVSEMNIFQFFSETLEIDKIR